MQLPMVGSWTVRVMGVRSFTIHGDLYFELQIVRVDEPGESGLLVRVPAHAVKGEPEAGEQLVLTFLMGQVTGAVRV